MMRRMQDPATFRGLQVCGFGDPGWAIDDDTLMVCQRFRLVERYPEPIAPEAA